MTIPESITTGNIGSTNTARGELQYRGVATVLA